jgi:two-component sensor histidine kinase
MRARDLVRAETVHRWALASRAWPTWVRYSITTIVVFGILWVYRGIGTALAGYPFLLFFPAIVVCGLLFNRGNGLYATGLSAVLAAFFMLPPSGIAVEEAADRLALVLFAGAGLVIAFAVEALHVALVQVSVEHARATTAARDRQLVLNELAHRTRNDLANVVMLLKLQVPTVDEPARQALMAAADRVQVVARVHRRLDVEGDRVVVDTKQYIGELCQDLRLSMAGTRPIAIRCNASSHSVSLEKAVPLGLIVNEMVTNAFKHAFPDGRPGVVEVTFEEQEQGYRLMVADNGVGLSGPAHSASLGQRLAQLLAAQLGGTIEIKARSPGTAVVFTMPRRTGE